MFVYNIFSSFRHDQSKGMPKLFSICSGDAGGSNNSNEPESFKTKTFLGNKLMRTGAKPVHGVAMEEDNQKKLLKHVFGGSSSSDSDTDEHALHLSQSTTNPSFMWERIDPIKGLWFCRDFLSSQQQFSLLSSIHTEGWLSEAGHNQAMRFGDLPIWALDLSDQIHEVVCFGDMEPNSGKLNLDSEPYVLPSQLLSRDPFFDQLIVNVYQPGEGICAHVDLMRFEDGIAIVSLESSCVMHFSPEEGNGEVPLVTKIPVYLTPGSLVIMWGDARYHWKHEINRKPEFQVWQGQEIDQKRRTSITLRKLCFSE